MMNLQYHKGQRCVCSSVFCQEGYCSECEIHAKHLSNLEVKTPALAIYRKDEVYTEEPRLVAVSR